MWFILWHAEPLLGCDREIGDCTAAVVRQTTTEEWCFLRGPLSNNLTATEEGCFLCCPSQDVMLVQIIPRYWKTCFNAELQILIYVKFCVVPRMFTYIYVVCC
jgi:hypothetical protein